MQTLSIKNFGPIKEVTIKITDLMIFIGPQASGKSTIAKNIYYFRSVRDFLFETIEEILNASGNETHISIEELWKIFQSNLRVKFIGFWGTAGHHSNFKLVFAYAENLEIEVVYNEGKINYRFSEELTFRITGIFGEVVEFLYHGKNTISEPGHEFEGYNGKNVKYSFLYNISYETKSVFDTTQNSFFIPANRSLITTLPDYLINLILRSTQEKQSINNALFDPYLIDLPTKQFINLISFIKTQFTKGFDEMIAEKENLTPEGIDMEALQPFIELIPQIL